MRWMPVSASILLGGAIALTGIWKSYGHGESTSAETGLVQRIGENQVRITEAAKKNLQFIEAKVSEYHEQIDIMGKVSVTENGTTMVPARVAGRVENIYAASGESVEAGQILAKIYSPDFAAAREEYLQAGQRKNAKNDSDFSNLHEMSRKKLQSLGLSDEDINNLAKSDPNLLIVHAPLAGVIIDKKAVLGSAVNIGDPLFTIGDLHKVWFLGDLYPEDLPKMHSDQEVMIDPVAGGDAIYGKVSFVSPVIDPNTRTIKFRVLMDNPNQALRADMYVQAHLILSTTKAIIIPTASIFNENGKNYLFKQTKDQPDVFEKIQVETGDQVHSQTVIRQGIDEGDKIIADGGLLLNAVLDNAGQ